MKNSYFTTPRTLSECTFFPSADPIERYRHSSRAAEFAVWIALGMGAVAAIVAGVLT